MIEPIALGQTKEYVAKIDKNSSNPTIWIIGAIDSISKSKITSSFLDIEIIDGKPEIKKNKELFSNSDFTIVKHGLKGFRNFGDIEFKTEKITLYNTQFDVVSEDIIKRIPLEIIHELAEIIWSENQVSEGLRKN